MARKSFVILALVAAALAGVQALALTRTRGALGEAAQRAAEAVASHVHVERAYAVDQTCGDKPVQPAVLTLDRVPTAEEILAQVAPGCRYAGARFAGVRFVAPQGAELTALQALGLPGADVESVRVEQDGGAAQATVTVAARRRALLLTARAAGRATFTPDKGPEALAREFVDSGVAQKAAELALGGPATVEEAVQTGSKGNTVPPPKSKEARAAEIAAWFNAHPGGSSDPDVFYLLVELCADPQLRDMVSARSWVKKWDGVCENGHVKGPDLSRWDPSKDFGYITPDGKWVPNQP